MSLSASDIKVGHTYEAKKPRGVFLLNDRQVLHISSMGTVVQYDSPTVPGARSYPRISMEKFLKWAGKDVTDVMPKGEWRVSNL